MNNSKIKIDHACGTHVGLVRQGNEDAYFADPKLGLWVVADGMGGHQAGEVASAIVVQEVPLSVQQGDSLVDAIEMAHEMIQMTSEQVRSSRHMGSTVVALQLEGLRYRIAWVGDSRAYLWNGKTLRCLTKDHSYVQTLLDMGMLLEDEVYTHPSRNVISQGLGVGGMVGNAVRVDQVEGTLALGDTVLLCSDGLTGDIRDYLIAEILATTRDNQKRLTQLIEAALAFGGADNVTVILVTPVLA
ncbi:MAG: PP2C family protein-serine/threonine phosphatase [Candidatus Methylumidiphilus sp.]